MNNLLRMLFVVSVAWFMSACTDDQVKARDPVKAASINVELGMAYMNEGNYNAASDRLEKAVRQNPRNPLAFSTKGLLHARLGQPEQAEEAFRRAVDLDGRDPFIRNNFGTFLCAQNRFKDAQEQFMAALSNPLYRTPEVAYTNAGLCTKDTTEAEKLFRKALQQNPKFPSALLQMAKISLDMKRYLSARGYLQRFHAVRKPTAESLWTSIQVEHVLGDRDTMRSHVLLLKNQFPDSDETRQYLEWAR